MCSCHLALQCLLLCCVYVLVSFNMWNSRADCPTGTHSRVMKPGRSDITEELQRFSTSACFQVLGEDTTSAKWQAVGSYSQHTPWNLFIRCSNSNVSCVPEIKSDVIWKMDWNAAVEPADTLKRHTLSLKKSNKYPSLLENSCVGNCGIYWQIMAKIKYTIHNHIFTGTLLPKNKNLCALSTYRGRRSSTKCKRL